MNITTEISSEQWRDLDLHQGDSLRVMAEAGSTLFVQIVKAAPPISLSKSKRAAGEWARKYAGVARGEESQEDVRMAHYQEKHGL